MRTADELAVWNKLDDVIMGGASDSDFELVPEGAGGEGAVWRGNLVVEVRRSRGRVAGCRG